MKKFLLPLIALFMFFWSIPADARTPVAKRHMRAAWIATVSNLDWPTAETAGIADENERITKSKEELVKILDRASEMKLNALFFQVGPVADAFYRSQIVPWSKYLTGTFGKDPGFDPLEFFIREAHKRNIEIHAWFNPYRLSLRIADTAEMDVEKSVFWEHPDWVITAGGKYVLDPGIPEARKWVLERVMEVVRNYDVDGVHFDDYFYTFTENEIQQAKDSDTFEKYGGGAFSNIGDWRRNNTYLLIKEVSEAVKAEKAWVKFGVSPIAVWENKSAAFPDGSETITSYTSYSRAFADTKRWVEEGIVDYIAPQIYFSFANQRASYGVLAKWWENVVEKTNVHLYIGQALYRVNADTDASFKSESALDEFCSQISYNINSNNIHGSIMFRMSYFDHTASKYVADMINEELWDHNALVPVMKRMSGVTVEKTGKGLLEKTRQSIKITWNDTGNTSTYYAIYRYDKGEKIDLPSDMSALKMIGKVRRTEHERQEFIDHGRSYMDEAVYVVTALDRNHNESTALEISTDQSAYFYDVGKSFPWAVYSIDHLFRKGIVVGVDKGYYDPTGYTRRADFVIMLERAFSLRAQYSVNYVDIRQNAYYRQAVGIAKELGITPAAEYFYPEDSITREDTFLMVFNVLKHKGIELPEAGEEYLQCYSDHQEISIYAREALARLTKAGLMAGANGRANPGAHSSRAEIAVILFRIIAAIGSGSLR